MAARVQLPLILTVVATCVAWAAWFGVIALTDPQSIGWEGFALFYLALLAAVSGSATVGGLFARRSALNRPHATRIAIRQGLLVGVAVTSAIFLQSRALFTWITMLFLIAALTLLELFWISLTQRTATPGVATS
ncbi:MAG: hypothetical protein Q7S96_03305 [bacterium]|nr:hypothetical protein [bacterium]